MNDQFYVVLGLLYDLRRQLAAAGLDRDLLVRGDWFEEAYYAV